MDIKTVILSLAIGNIVFGLTLFLYQLHERHSPKNRFWTAAKVLQAGGWLLLYYRGEISDLLSFGVGNALLLSGFAYECWAMFRISGRTVDRKYHVGVAAVTAFVCLAATPWPPAGRIALASFMVMIFFALSGWAMLYSIERKSPLRIYLGGSMLLVTLIVFLRGFWALYTPDGFVLFSRNLVQQLTFISQYYLLLTNGFGMLLLTREAADRDVDRLLKEQQVILDTLPTGLCVLRDRVIVRCNPAMEAMFGFAPGALAGKSVRSLYASDELFAEYGQKIYSAIKREGRFEGEVLYMRQNGEPFWALDHGRTIFPERAESHAVFSITDISDQIRQKELLTRQNEELEATLARTKRLEGIISICMYCKKIDNKDDSWAQLETYISEHSDALFSHGICPECYRKGVFKNS